MNERQFAGARWWKFDFHTHTPASDFQGTVTRESWLKAFMDQEIDCVAITDHNSGGWIDGLKQTLAELEESKPDWYRPLYLFPGVEISTHGNVHILAIFGCDKNKGDIDGLLSVVGYSGTKGGSDAVTSKSITDVVDAITEQDGIPIPAHVDKKKECFIEALEISAAKYIGKSEPLSCQFSPFLNTIIGGRGSGKSTLLEFMRLVLRRDKDIPKTLKEESRQYFDAEEEDSLLIKDSKISLIYRKGEVHYRLNWSAKANCFSLEENKDSTWTACPGEIKSLFPVRIYSQKQIFELAKNPRALIGIIDEAPEVDAGTIKAQHRELVNQYKQIEGKQRELNEKITRKNRMRGEYHDLTRQIEQIEKSAHATVLRNYRKREQQLSEFNNLESKWKGMSHRLATTRDAIAPANFNRQLFSEHTDILSVLKAKNEKWEDIRDKLSELEREAELVINDWYAEKNVADWMRALKTDMEQYELLSTELKQQGIDPSRYPQLLTQQKNIQKELDLIDEYQLREKEREAEKREVFKQIKENRKILSKKRQEFLTSVLQNNQAVSIKVKLFGEDWEGIEEELRGILQCQAPFDKDIEDLEDIYQENGVRGIEKLKEAIKGIRNGERDAKDKRFTKHLKSLTQESVIDLILWFPRDDLKITFGPNRQPIEQSSPGQRNAALLAFILSYGDEPLLLDQPEDDLDNELIYSLIVRQLRETKSRRQVIVVTHNANIVVNGDAEMVLPLEVGGGETHVRRAASIQKKEVREAICNILEGGQQAFEQRYKRIHLGD